LTHAEAVDLVGILKWPVVVLVLLGGVLVYLLPHARGFVSRLTLLKYKDAEAVADQAAVRRRSRRRARLPQDRTRLRWATAPRAIRFR
jgi:hypothetical protein